MPKKGYKSVTISEESWYLAAKKAGKKRRSIANLIEIAIEELR